MSRDPEFWHASARRNRRRAASFALVLCETIPFDRK